MLQLNSKKRKSEESDSKEDEEKAKILLEKNTAGSSLFFIEKLGYFLILISGLMPFVHSFVKKKVLEERFFGFPSIQSFLYSLGVHLSILFLVIGILMAISVANSPSRYKIIQNYLRYTLISPFVSGVFYLTWVFIPNVDYNLLAYIFLALIISVLSLIIFGRVLKYINILKLDYNEQLDFIKSSISNIKIGGKPTKLSVDVTNNILYGLNKFEESKRYVDKDISLKYLAIEMNTNSKYLSKTINQEKKKTFTQYINDLRIEYSIELLTTNKKYANYTIQAIAEEIGFKTSRAFSTSFFKKIGKYPSEYIKEMSD